MKGHILNPKKVGEILHEVAGLFAGVGGIERGLARSGHRATLLCEMIRLLLKS